MTLQQFNNSVTEQLRIELIKCCGSSSWVENVLPKLPFASIDILKKESDRIWFSLTEKDWKEAFAHHPKIGDVEILKKKFASTANWVSGEQAGVQSANEKVLIDLKSGNDDYELKFGYMFIVCATGKSAEEMLSILQMRLKNSPEEEIKIAAEEQNKITHLRFDKLFS